MHLLKSCNTTRDVLCAVHHINHHICTQQALLATLPAKKNRSLYDLKHLSKSSVNDLVLAFFDTEKIQQDPFLYPPELFLGLIIFFENKLAIDKASILKAQTLI